MRGNTFGTRVHEHKVAGAIGILRHTWFKTSLPKGSSLLISRVASQFDRPAKELWISLSEDSTGRT